MKVFVIGNGFSINLVNLLEKHKYIDQDVIDLKNLFSKGDKIPNETFSDCYLSPSNCPQLWRLGVRSTIDNETSSTIINHIISSYLFYIKKCNVRGDEIDNNHSSVITYLELNRYLKKLMVYYDGIIFDALNKLKCDNMSSIIFPLIDEISKNDIVISYNYDVSFERLLKMSNKSYSYMFNHSNDNKNIRIYKPHGSINFDCINIDNKINNIYDLTSNQITIINFDENKLSNDFKHSFIIPPSGFIVGGKDSWVSNIRTGICDSLNDCCPDQVVFFGHSYGVVDRDEINEIISWLDSKCTKIAYINPVPSSSLDYILSQNFDRYYHKKS